jgi:hypothetical protein
MFLGIKKSINFDGLFHEVDFVRLFSWKYKYFNNPTIPLKPSNFSYFSRQYLIEYSSFSYETVVSYTCHQSISFFLLELQSIIHMPIWNRSSYIVDMPRQTKQTNYASFQSSLTVPHIEKLFHIIFEQTTDFFYVWFIIYCCFFSSTCYFFKNVYFLILIN